MDNSAGVPTVAATLPATIAIPVFVKKFGGCPPDLKIKKTNLPNHTTSRNLS
jgi:hypothetical protein